MPEYRAADTVFCFVSTGRGDRHPSHSASCAGGGKNALRSPVSGRRHHGAAQHQSLNALTPGAYGIPEPPEDAPLVSTDTVDFAVLPCLTCNHLGQRLGRGGGYYDRFLASYRGGTVLLCRERLIREEIPVTSLDYPIPWVPD